MAQKEPKLRTYRVNFWWNDGVSWHDPRESRCLPTTFKAKDDSRVLSKALAHIRKLQRGSKCRWAPEIVEIVQPEITRKLHLPLKARLGVLADAV